MLSRQNLPMPLLRVVLQFLSLAVSVMDILVMSQDEASARRTKRARAHYHEAKSVAVETMTSATRRSRRSGDGAHELFRPPNADGIVPHLILGIF